MSGVSVVIPVFQSEATLKELTLRLKGILDSVSSDYEIILVEDGGRDRSWRIIQDLVQSEHRVRGVRLRRNYGQHNALLCGIRLARYEITVTLDDDLQHPPEEIPKLLEKLQEGYDVVYGIAEKKRQSASRRLSSRLLKLVLQKAMGEEAARHLSPYRAFRTPLKEAFAGFQGPFVSIDALLTWGARQIASVKVSYEPRKVGGSNYDFRRLLTHAVNVMTAFSTAPLRLASWLGFFMTLFGIGILIYVVGRYLITGHSVPGFPFLASVLALFSGAQLFTLGILGEYLARIHDRLMGKPAYSIESEAGGAP